MKLTNNFYSKTLKQRVKANLFTVLFALMFFGCTSSRDKIDSYLGFDISKEEIDEYLEQQMEELTIPGVSIAFINDGEIAYYNTYGYANVDKEVKVDVTTIFEGASISKSVFAFFVMTFVDEGKLDLDKPLYEYLPNKDLENDARYKNITARMVLSHRSGLPNWREDEADQELKLKFNPGTDYLYSGEGYQYLASVLKTIVKTDWPGLEKKFQEKVAIPLAMEHSVFIQNSYTKQNKAEPYDENGSWIDWQNNYWYQKNDTVFTAPASLHSEAKDFFKWMEAVMNNKILSSNSYSELLKPHSLVEESSFYDVHYTLGFFHLDMPFTDLYFHSGNNEGFTSFFAFDKNKKWGYVLFTNSESGETLGNNLLIYLLAGPDKAGLYIVLASILLGVIVIITLFIRYIFKRLKRRKAY